MSLVHFLLFLEQPTAGVAIVVHSRRRKGRPFATNVLQVISRIKKDKYRVYPVGVVRTHPVPVQSVAVAVWKEHSKTTKECRIAQNAYTDINAHRRVYRVQLRVQSTITTLTKGISTANSALVVMLRE